MFENILSGLMYGRNSKIRLTGLGDTPNPAFSKNRKRHAAHVAAVRADQAVGKEIAAVRKGKMSADQWSMTQTYKRLMNGNTLHRGGLTIGTTGDEAADGHDTSVNDVIDQSLKQYATAAQRIHVDAVNEHGSVRAAARALGIHHSAIQRTVTKLQKADMEAGVS